MHGAIFFNEWHVYSHWNVKKKYLISVTTLTLVDHIRQRPICSNLWRSPTLAITYNTIWFEVDIRVAYEYCMYLKHECILYCNKNHYAPYPSSKLGLKCLIHGLHFIVLYAVCPYQFIEYHLILECSHFRNGKHLQHSCVKNKFLNRYWVT